MKADYESFYQTTKCGLKVRPKKIIIPVPIAIERHHYTQSQILDLCRWTALTAVFG